MRRKVWKKLILIAIWVVVTPLVLEVMLRLGGGIYLGVQEIRNIVSLKIEGDYRILCLGESTTAFQYPGLLEEELNRVSGNRKFSVIDKGVPGTDTSRILEDLKANIKRYRPDMVIAMMGINDMADTPRHTGRPQERTPVLLVKNMRVLKLVSLLKKHFLSNTGITGAHIKKRSGAGGEDGENDLESNLEAAGSKADVYINHARTLVDTVDYVGAKKMYLKAIQEDRENDTAYFELGLMFQNIGRVEEAEPLYRRALAANPDHDLAYYNLGWLYFIRKDYKTARSIYERGISASPDFEMSYIGLAWTYWEQGIYDETARVLQEGVKMVPYSSRIYGLLIQAYERLGDIERMKAIEKKAYEQAARAYYESTKHNYRLMKKILEARGIVLVCMQYPLKSIEPLMGIFDDPEGIIFINNYPNFRNALKKGSYTDYFRDMCFGNFGHCNRKGNMLIAKNAADVLMSTCFSQKK